MDQKHIEILMDRGDMRRKEDLERSMSGDDTPTQNSCDECGEGPAYAHGDGMYCYEHRPGRHSCNVCGRGLIELSEIGMGMCLVCADV